jgi:hypothetical protein
MFTPLAISIVIAIVCLFMILALTLGRSDYWPIPVVVLIFDIMLGFGVICSLRPVTTKEEILIPIEIAKGQTFICIKAEDGKTYQSNEHMFFIVDEKKIKVKRTTTYNSYGLECGTVNEGLFIDATVLEKEAK